MSLDEGISNLIKRIYCARENADEWNRIADEIMRLTGASGAFTFLVDLRNREYSGTQAYGAHDSRFARGIEEYSEIYTSDPSLVWASQNPRARFCDSSCTVPAETYLSHPYVRWNRARFGSTHWYVGFTPPEDHLSYSFSVHFPAEQGPGHAEALRLFRLLFDHMDSALRLTCRPFNSQVSRPLLLLDSAGMIRGITDGAERALAKPDGLTIEDGRLRTAVSAEQIGLDAAIARAASVTSMESASEGVKVSRPSGQRPWILTIRRLLSGYGPFGKVKCELLVQIHDGSPHIGSLHLLQQLFDLTSRELQVARLLADGHSVESLAAYMTISPNTAKTHLRSIFSKTAVNRQSELLQLCASLTNC